jgi:hypothetical protein
MIENWGSRHAYVWPETTVVVLFGHRCNHFVVGRRQREIARFTNTLAIQEHKRLMRRMDWLNYPASRCQFKV